MAVMQKSDAVARMLTAAEAYENMPDEAASAATKALVLWRAGEPNPEAADEHAAWVEAKADALTALAVEASVPLASDPRPIQDSISRRQFGQACMKLSFMTEDEAFDFVQTNQTPASMLTAIDALPLPAETKRDIKYAVAGSQTFQRLNQATTIVMMAMGRSTADRDAIWRLGATLP
ncbi:MAG: hypothetical protein KDK08_05640 [Rhizobiaceae bacterium]|nr:hypothetical protein [Rhizobiaceae bacterium]